MREELYCENPKLVFVSDDGKYRNTNSDSVLLYEYRCRRKENARETLEKFKVCDYDSSVLDVNDSNPYYKYSNILYKANNVIAFNLICNSIEILENLKLNTAAVSYKYPIVFSYYKIQYKRRYESHEPRLCIIDINNLMDRINCEIKTCSKKLKGLNKIKKSLLNYEAKNEN